MLETDFIICPICRSSLERQNNSFICTNGSDKHHCFDISSSGYADLSYRAGGAGDSKELVNDRTAFLDSGYYKPIADALINICSEYFSGGKLIIDAGCGEGYYSEMIASALPESFVFGADLSKHAVHRASSRRNARCGKNSFYAVSSLFSLPIADLSADGIVSMFAPVAENEFLRVLSKEGYLIIGAAGVSHLVGLKEAIYDNVRLNDMRADLPIYMKPVDHINVSYEIYVDNNSDIQKLFGMTPYKYRTSGASIERLNLLKYLNTEINVDFYVFKK